MSDAMVMESLKRIRQKIQDAMQAEGLSEKVKNLKMIEELIMEQVKNENPRRTIGPAR